jgi:uncharacterized protein
VTKILVVILVTVLVVYLMRRLAQGREDKPLPPAEKRAVEDMVRCRVCGVNLPRSEAILSHGRIYCCDEHRQSDA